MNTRTFVAGIAILAILACRQGKPSDTNPAKWPEDSNRRYFLDSFAYIHGLSYNPDDTAHNFLHFFRVRYQMVHTRYPNDPLPYALDEEYIDTTKIDSRREWFRVTIYPFFDVPYCFTVEKKAGQTLLTTKISDGRGRYYPGELKLVKRTVLRDSALFSPSTGWIPRMSGTRDGTPAVELMAMYTISKKSEWELTIAYTCGSPRSAEIPPPGRHLKSNRV